MQVKSVAKVGGGSSCGPGCLSSTHNNRPWPELPAHDLNYAGMQAHCQGFCSERQMQLNYTPLFVITLTGSTNHLDDKALGMSVREFWDWVS